MILFLAQGPEIAELAVFSWRALLLGERAPD